MPGTKKIKKVLIVDDDPVMVKMLETRLKANGYEVSAVTEATDGLQIAMDTLPDLVILDVMMPIINGYNFCRLLKADEKGRNVAIILLTSRNEIEDIKTGFEMGADAYLTKPINIDKLLDTIKVIESKAE